MVRGFRRVAVLDLGVTGLQASSGVSSAWARDLRLEEESSRVQTIYMSLIR